MARRKILMAVFGLATLVVPTSAGAQNLVPGFGWSGPYWGLSGGGAWADVRNAKTSADLVWSGHAGYGLQLSSVYVGAEVDGAWGGTKSTSYLSALYSSSLEVDWSATARARVGVVAGGALLYVTGGAAWSGQTLGVHSLGHELSTSSKSIPGVVYGAGVELKILPFVSARLEALRYDYSSQSARFGDAIPAGISSGAWKNINLDETVVRAGLSLRFN